jgi:hypothetical protein
MDAIADNGAAANETRYFIGVDLGQSRDPTSIAVVRRTEIEPTDPIYARGSREW